MTTTPAPSPDPPAELARTVLCPACGYDLRGVDSDRCSECGLVLDRATLDRSGFPWAYREKLGRVRAFLKTVWLVTIDAKSLRNEAAKPQSPGDAAVFRRWVCAVLALCFAAVVTLILLNDGHLEWAVQKPSPFAPGTQMPGYMQDLLVPWSAGMTMPPALFLYALLLSTYVVSAVGRVIRARDLPPDYQQSVKAIGRYMTAPLAWLLPGIMGYLVLFWLESQDARFDRSPLFPVLIGGSFLLLLLGIGSTVHRVGQWKARVTHRGYATGFLAMGELLLRWGVGGAILLFVVPWCVGFVWIVIDSFRA